MANSFPPINSSESMLTGRQTSSNGELSEDGAAIRIRFLAENVLELIASDESGWFTLYRDPFDGRYWELSYPDSQCHGAGAPRLEVISDAELANRYKLPSS